MGKGKSVSVRIDIHSSPHAITRCVPASKTAAQGTPSGPRGQWQEQVIPPKRALPPATRALQTGRDVSREERQRAKHPTVCVVQGRAHPETPQASQSPRSVPLNPHVEP